MELRLTVEEVALLYEMLKARNEALRNRLEEVSNREMERELEHSHGSVKGLLDHLMARGLKFAYEELDDLARLLAEYDRQFAQEISREEDPEHQSTMQRKQVVLKLLRDKVTEACVML